jgi:hypothetical protein
LLGNAASKSGSLAMFAAIRRASSRGERLGPWFHMLMSLICPVSGKPLPLVCPVQV